MMVGIKQLVFPLQKFRHAHPAVFCVLRMSNKYKQQVISFFNRRTAYDTEGDSHLKEAKQLLKYISIKSGQTILDIATGTGLIAIAAAKKAAPNVLVVGVDISSGMLAQAKSKIVAQKNINLFVKAYK